MKILSEQEIEQLFDSFCKKVLKNRAPVRKSFVN